jgi:peptidoglycan/LPS O-acetylase OafA/YrhL
MNLANFKYRADIDGLRALAVLLVLIFHFKLLPLGKGGFMGVDIFFVISGYLITSIILRELQTDTFSFKTFYYRRIKRLAPPLFATLFLVLIYGYFQFLPSDLTELSWQILASQFYFSNIYFWQNLNYFGLHADSTVLLHTWSLAVEEQFYILYPIVLFTVHRYLPRYLFHFILAGILVSFALNIYFVDKKPEFTFYMLPTRAWELLAGASLVYLAQFYDKLNARQLNIIGTLGLLIIILAVLFHDNEVQFPGSYALWPVLGSMLLIISGTNSNSKVSEVFSNKVIVYVGKISYSLYLVHWPINVFAREYFHSSYELEVRFFMFIISFAVASVIFHLVEKPLRKNKLKLSPKIIVSHYFIVLVITVGIVYWVQATGGLKGRFSEQALYYSSFSEDTAPEYYKKCTLDLDENKGSEDDFCKLGDSTRSPTWLIMGDSHALAISPAFDLFLKEINESAYFVYRHACPPLNSIYIFRTLGNCKKFNDEVISKITQLNLQKIFLVSTWIYPEEASITDNPDKQLSVLDSKLLFSSSFDHTIELLNNLNLDVYVWEPIPIANGNVPRALANSNDVSVTAIQLGTTYEAHLQRFSYYYEAQRRNLKGIKGVVSPSNFMCKSARCIVLRDNVPLYSDNSHVSFSARYFFAKQILKQYITMNNKHK